MNSWPIIPFKQGEIFIYGVDSFSLTSVSGTTATLLQERASERWIQWLGLESDYHCSFSSTRNAEDVVAGEAARVQIMIKKFQE